MKSVSSIPAVRCGTDLWSHDHHLPALRKLGGTVILITFLSGGYYTMICTYIYICMMIMIIIIVIIIIIIVIIIVIICKQYQNWLNL